MQQPNLPLLMQQPTPAQLCRSRQTRIAHAMHGASSRRELPNVWQPPFRPPSPGSNTPPDRGQGPACSSSEAVPLRAANAVNQHRELKTQALRDPGGRKPPKTPTAAAHVEHQRRRTAGESLLLAAAAQAASHKQVEGAEQCAKTVS